ncbi:MAG: hypothetical protein KJZ95_19605, partial [Caldilinea sp.]|nr:hypothetical protein [Caldilinea sp.]
MSTNYVQPMGFGRGAYLVGAWQNPVEQIRKMVNLLMVLSMLLSTMAPIYQPRVGMMPSFALPEELRGFTSSLTQPEINHPLETGGSSRALGSMVAPTWYSDLARPATAVAPIEPSDLALAPTGRSDFARLESAIPSADVLGDALAPAWYSALAQTEAAVAPSLLFGNALTASSTPIAIEDRFETDVLLPKGWSFIDPSSIQLDAPSTAHASTWMDTSLAPAWYASVENVEAILNNRSGIGGSDFESIFFRPLEQESNDQCAPSGNVMTLTPPPYAISRGNIYGDVYTVTIRNNSSVLTTTNVTLRINPNVGFYYLGESATVESSISGSLTYTDTGVGLPGADAFIAVTGDITATTLDPGEVMTFTFMLATNSDAISAQPLEVMLYSGAQYCAVGQIVNVQTVRGNLTVQKSPNIRSAWLGDVLDWTITLRNTGLGTVYHAQVADIFGAGYINSDLSGLPTEPITLEAGASATYYVTGTVNACSQLTNTAQAWWSIGNQDATATITNPASSQVDVRFNLVNPSVSLQVSPNALNIPFCTPMTQTVVITATANEAAKNVQIVANTQGFNVANVSAGWSYTNGVFTYVGGTPVGVMYKDSPVTLTFDLSSPTACTTNNYALNFRPTYQNACDVPFNGTAVSAPTVNYAPDRPTLNVSQSAPYAVRSRGTFT